MCCNTFTFDTCNMIVLSNGQDGEGAAEGLLSVPRSALNTGIQPS
jgi:hypothetical protein